jgi:DNA primase
MHDTVNHFSRQSKSKGISAEALEAIRSVSPIVDVAAEHVKLRRSGSQFAGKCPLHEERTPSFYINPAKGVFHCHGCQAGGDVFRFVQLLHNCTFRQAVKHLATRAGVDLAGFKPSAELTAKIAAVKKQGAEEERFERFRNERLDAIGRKYRSLGRAATHAENYLLSGSGDPYLEDLAWDALRQFVDFEARIEREGLLDIEMLRKEWKGCRYAA